MIEVGESTGALPAMLNSVAEFYEDDVNTRMTATLSLIEPAIMIFMGGFVAFVLIALYLPIFSWRTRFDEDQLNGMATTDRTRFAEPAAEIAQAQAMAARYRCEFVDLREARIDHDLFHSIPVDLMFRYNFVPMHAQNGHAGYRALRSAESQPDRRTDAAAEQEAARQGGHALADFRSAQEDRAIAARAGRSHRRLRAGCGGGRRRFSDETLSIDKLTATTAISRR